MNLPNKQTIKVFELRKQYLHQRAENGKTLSSYELAELRAIDSAINLIELIKNHVSETVMQDALRQSNRSQANVCGPGPEAPGPTGQDPSGPDTADDEKYQTLYADEKAMGENTKLEIEFHKHNGRNQIMLALKKYQAGTFSWASRKKVIVTRKVLQELLDKYDSIFGKKITAPEPADNTAPRRWHVVKASTKRASL
jgi:hypothetical protein